MSCKLNTEAKLFNIEIIRYFTYLCANKINSKTPLKHLDKKVECANNELGLIS